MTEEQANILIQALQAVISAQLTALPIFLDNVRENKLTVRQF